MEKNTEKPNNDVPSSANESSDFEEIFPEKEESEREKNAQNNVKSNNTQNGETQIHTKVAQDDEETTTKDEPHNDPKPAQKATTSNIKNSPMISNKYGGIYVEITEDVEKHAENTENVKRVKESAENNNGKAKEITEAILNINDEDVQILGVVLKELQKQKDEKAGKKNIESEIDERQGRKTSEGKNTDELASLKAIFNEGRMVEDDAEEFMREKGKLDTHNGLLEGMCPVTGNYLRGYESNIDDTNKSRLEIGIQKNTKQTAPNPDDIKDYGGSEDKRNLDASRLQRLNELIREAKNWRTQSGPKSRDNDLVSTQSYPLTPTKKNENELPISTNDEHLASMEEGDLNQNQLTTTSSKSGKLNRAWSTRMIRTLSNRNRKEDADSDEEDADNCVFGNQIRFTIMIISTLCLSSILSNILTFNFTFICMSGPRPDNFSQMTIEELQASGYRPELDYDSTHRSALFMAVAVGAILAVFPLTIMLNKFGSRRVFGALGYISAVSTLLIPFSANAGFAIILIMRVIQGAGFSACLPVMGSITSHWSTLKQNGIFIAILSSFLQIAPIFTMPIAGELCESDYGWESVYYLHGVVCIVAFTVFILYHRNTPNKHPLIMRKELVKVMFGKGSIYSGPGRRSSKSKKVPYQALYRDPAIWSIFVAAFGNFMGTQLSLQFMPTYINKVLFLPISQTGMASAISPIVMFFIKLVAGQSSDKITFISDQWKLRIYNTLSLGLMGVFFIVLALLNPLEQKSLCLVVLILSTCILGFNSGGFFKSSQMVSRQHSHFTLANISFVNCVCMLIVPLLNEIIAPENTPETWAIVLWIHGIILLVTNAFFCVLCSSKPAPWTLETWTNESANERARRKRSSRVAPQRQSEIRRTQQDRS